MFVAEVRTGHDSPPCCLRASLKFSFVRLCRDDVLMCSVAVGGASGPF